MVLCLEGSLPTKKLTLVGSSSSGVMAWTFPPTQRSEITQLLEGHTFSLHSSFLTATCKSSPSLVIQVVPKYPGAEKSALSSHWPSFLTQPRSKVASLAETDSLEGNEEVGEELAFVRLFEVVDWLLASQIKDSKLAISTRVKNTFFGMFVSSLKGFIKGPFKEP